jgi:sulfopyruvate decarboxylase subunit alpha
MLRATSLVGALVENGVTHLIWLPDTETASLLQALGGQPHLRLVPVAREGEALPIAAGLWAGGQRPAVLIQSTGFFEAGDSVRGIGLDLGLPLVMLVGYRGYRRQGPVTDSAAVYLEPVLRAWGIPYSLLQDDTDLYRVREAFDRAERDRRLVALLIAAEYDQEEE